MMPYYWKRKKKKSDTPTDTPTNTPKRRKRKVKGEETLEDLVKKLDKVFSLYIRLRDVMPSGLFRCISCGQIKPYSQEDCGHYISRTNMITRFDEDNCNGECRACNRLSSDHLIGYRKNLITKIGLDRVSALEWKRNQIKHWTKDELREKISYYTLEVKRLSADKGISVKI